MKRFFLIFFVQVCISGVLFSGTVEKTYFFKDLKITQIAGHQILSFDNTWNTGLRGEPVIPYHQVVMMLPPGEKAVNMEVIRENEIPVAGIFDLYPQQEVQPISKGSDGKFIKNASVYLLNGNYPATASGQVVTSYLNGYAFAMSAVTPVVYNPAKRSVSYFSSVTIRITTKADPASQAALKNLPHNETMTGRVRAFAQNPEMIGKYPAPKSTSIDYSVLIITPAQFVTGFQPLVDHYNALSIPTQVTSTESIEASGTGQDLQEKIRNYIIAEYQNSGVNYVLLGGDIEYFPFRGFYCYVESGSGYEDESIPADLYFSALDGNWNANGNSRWGEPGEEDLLPDVAVARFPFSYASELENMVHKSITYQTFSNTTEFNRPVMVAEWLYSGPDTWGDDYLNLLINDHSDNGYFTHGINPATSEIDTTMYDNPGYSWTTQEVINKINTGRSFIHHCGHANEIGMMRLNRWDISNETFPMVNGIDHNYTLMYSHGCLCGAFDYSQGDCIAEKCVTIDNFLAAGVFNSRYGWFNQGETEGPSAHLHREFVSSLYNDTTPVKEIGEAHRWSKIRTAPWVTIFPQFEPGAQRWCFYDCNAFGDPVLKIWTDAPVGQPELTLENGLTVRPNPARDQVELSFHMNQSSLVQLSLFTSTGSMIWKTAYENLPSGDQKLAITLPRIPSGMYYLQLKDGETTRMKKLIVVR